MKATCGQCVSGGLTSSVNLPETASSSDAAASGCHRGFVGQAESLVSSIGAISRPFALLEDGMG